MPTPQKVALIIGHTWPEPKTTAAGHHMMQLLEAFKQFGYQLFFASTAAKTEYSQNLTEIGVEEVNIRLNHSSFDIFISELEPEIVVFDRFMVEEQFGWRIAEHASKALRILNTEDLHSLRKTRSNCHSGGEEFTIEKWLQNNITKREVASIYRSDLSLLVSTHEMELLQQNVKIDPNLLLHLPFMLEKLTDKAINNWSSFEERSGFSCFGNGKHAPNVDSIKYLKHVIWPLIRTALPNAQVTIFGAYLPQQILGMHSPRKGFLVNGWAADLNDALQKTRINLAPLQFGAGIKGKLVDAMKNGTPSVTTTIGAEGMYGKLPWAGAIAQDPKDFAQQAVQLYQNKPLWTQKQQNGVAIINQFYDKELLSKHLLERIAHLKKELEVHRSQNFIGSMLQHQTLAATKFMGKWIEEKTQGN